MYEPFLLLLLFSNILLLTSCLPLCHDHERVSLLRFKQSFSIDMSASSKLGYPKTDSWGREPSECCLWDGVECNNDTGHVIGLNLSSSFLYGSIDSNSSLFELVHLQSLSLADNDFNYSRIPSSFNRLSMLTHLNLSLSLFSGQFPSEISQLSKLSSLDLSIGYLSGPIPSSFSSLTQLTYLSLAENKFSNESISWVGNLTKLVYLNLDYFSFVGTVPPSFSNLQNLETLFLRGNNLSGKLDINIFLSLKNLTHLNLSKNRLEVVTKPSANTTLPQFTYLVLDYCNLTTFPDFLRYQHRIVWLSLRRNQIGGQIPKWALNISLETLMALDLSYNLLTGFEESPVSLPWLKLKALSLHHNMLNSALPIPPKSTIVYTISYNNLTGKVSPLICNAHSLIALQISFNKLDGDLPPCLGSFSDSLSFLDLSNNAFVGEVSLTFVQGNQLRSINLSNNRLQGKLLRSLANCRKLEHLALANNQLNDFFPVWLGSLPKLQLLIIRNNSFHGSIGDPSTNFEFQNLRIIDVSYNCFTGKLPAKYIDNWKAMKNITRISTYMKSTAFFGMDMHFVFYDTVILTIKGFDRSFNKIQDVLAAIDFSNNKFDGRIPEVIGKLKGLHYLKLSDNNLTGGIPPSLGDISELESLDLSQNMLSGTIPRDLMKLNFLQHFNISHNELTGLIPQESQLSRFESSSYEGNMGLCGIPLPNKCGDASSEDGSEQELVQPSSGSEDEWLNFGWKVIAAIGYTCGFVVGVLLGKVVVLPRRPRWFSMIYRVRILSKNLSF